MNLIIHLINALLNWIISLVPIPAFITPPNGTPIYMMRIKKLPLGTDIQVKKGVYFFGKWLGEYLGPNRNELLDSIVWWSFKDPVQIPTINFNRDPLFDGVGTITIRSDRRHRQVWDYRHIDGKKMNVTYDMRKQLEKNPFATTLPDKAKRLEKKTEKIREEKFNAYKKTTGKDLW